jgi:hypothetical protein
LVVVAVPKDQSFERTSAQIVESLVAHANVHTVAFNPEFSLAGGDLVKKAVPVDRRLRIFFDTLDPTALNRTVSGENEIRIVIWSRNEMAQLWDHLDLSPASMEFLVVPSELAHPQHPARRLIDTTPYLRADDALQILSL